MTEKDPISAFKSLADACDVAAEQARRFGEALAKLTEAVKRD